MIRFLAGDSEYFVRRRERKVRQDFSERFPDAQILILDFEVSGDEESCWRLWLEASQQGLFAEQKLLVIRNILQHDIFSEKMMKELGMHQELLTDTVTHALFVESGTLKKKNDFAIWLSKKAEIISPDEKFSPNALEQYALSLFAESGTKCVLSLPALRALLLECGNNMYRLESELRKLAFLKSEGTLSEQDVRDLISFAPGGTVFEALDLIVAGRRDGAIQLFARELGKGEEAFRILGSCAWQLRVLLSVRDAYDRGIRQSQAIADQAGMKEYSVRKCLSRIASLPMDRLRQSLEFLAEADVLMKTGGMRPDLAVYLFVVKF